VAKKGKDRPFLMVEEENTVFQLNYSKTLGTKSYRCHGHGYMAKYLTRSSLLKHREEDAARSEVLARQERMQHQQEVEELKEKLANEVSARERDKEESMKQIEEIREEFWSNTTTTNTIGIAAGTNFGTWFSFFCSSILANVPCLLGCTGYHRNHQHHIASKWPKSRQQLHHTTTHRGCSYRGNKNATRLLTKDATCLHIKCNLFTSKHSFW